MLTNEQLQKIERDSAKATHGPWEVHTRSINHYKGSSYPTHTIRTSWIQGQLKDKMPVVDTATGLGESPGKPSYTVWMTMEDGTHIANCDPQTIAELVKMARRYAWLREQHWNKSQLIVVTNPKDSVKLGTDCPSGNRLDAAIDQAIAGGWE